MDWWKRAIADKSWHPLWINVGLKLVAIAITYIVIVAKSHSLLTPLPLPPSTGASENETKAYRDAAVTLSAQYGQMGDAVGGLLNPILTFLSCIGLLVTIVVSLHAVNETRELAAKQQQNEKLSTMIAVLTTLYQAAADDYEHYKSSSGNGSHFAAKARGNMTEIKELLNTLYLQLHREDFPEALVPKSILSEELARQKEGPKDTTHFSTSPIKIRLPKNVAERYNEILSAMIGAVHRQHIDVKGATPDDSAQTN